MACLLWGPPKWEAASPAPPTPSSISATYISIGALVELEPEFQPETVGERRTILEHEKPHIVGFAYADFPGFAVLHVSDTGIRMEVHVGSSDAIWKSVSLAPGRRSPASN